MTKEYGCFIKKYARAINNGTAAVFAGAGLSVPSGYISWKELLRPLAEEIGLSVDKEQDYLAIAQYYRNEEGNRAEINSAILEAFTKETKENENVNLITGLPIDTYWTTNYDQLLEEGLKKNGRKTDVKITNENLANNIRGCSATVYKMHGDVQFSEDAVLTKEDYETYRIKREPFTAMLRSHLLSKTFLFIGFSFDDPNLGSILSWIKNLLGENVRKHYCFFEKLKQGDKEATEDFEYRNRKQKLRIDDLKRYGVEAVLLESYSDIPKILRAIEKQCILNNIFISGSMAFDNDSWTIDEAQMFTSKLAQGLVAGGKYITSGYGFGIGGSVITGVLKEAEQRKSAHFDEYLKLYPFPQPEHGTSDAKLDKIWHAYRLNIMEKCGVAIFIFGNKKDEAGKKISASGMRKEWKIAKEKKNILIPIASTDDTALEIYKEMYKEKENYKYLDGYWESLETEKDVEKLVKIVLEIINKAVRCVEVV